MNVLFLARPGFDFLQDVVFHGLVQLLGPESVVEYPPNERYHSPPPPDTAYAPLFFDLPATAPVELGAVLGDADLVVAGCLSPDVVATLRTVLALPDRPPVAVLDGEDWPYVRGVVREVEAYCKTQTLAAGARPRPRDVLALARGRLRRAEPLLRYESMAVAGKGRITPLPFGVIDAPFEAAAEKLYDVAFVGYPYRAERERVVRQLAELRSAGAPVFTLGPEQYERLSWQEYMRVLSASRVCISLAGQGRQTMRYWEIPYAGSALVSDRHGLALPDDFVAEEEALFAPPERVVERALALAADPGRAEEIAARGRAKVMSHHRSVHRAEALLAAVGTVVGLP